MGLDLQISKLRTPSARGLISDLQSQFDSLDWRALEEDEERLRLGIANEIIK
jgi:hypothetical protein